MTGVAEPVALAPNLPAVAPFCLGGNVFGWTVTDDHTAFAILDRYVAAGWALIDTADAYSTWVPGHTGGESERLLGRWLKRSGARNRVVIATKVGLEMPPANKGLSRRWILQACEDSLRRLQVDCIDLYQSHRDDPETPQEETLQAYADLIKQGKVRAIGASNFTVERLRAAHAISRENRLPRYECLQPRYNLMERELFEGPLAAYCQAESVAVIPHSGLARSFLTGKYRNEAELAGTARGDRVRPYLISDRGPRVLAALDAIAAETASTPAAVALAWLRRQPGVSAPIASVTSVHQLEQVLRSVAIELTADHQERLRQASR